MQNFEGSSRTSILKELPMGNSELGEAFALTIDDMVTQSGITNPKAHEYDIVSKSWRTLAGKPDKTSEDIKKLDKTFKDNVMELAQSYLLFIAMQTGNTSGKLTYPEFEKFMFKYRFGHYDIENKQEYINKVKVMLGNAFKKLSAHGEPSGDDIIDKDDMAAYIYALATKVKHTEDKKFAGFEIDGIIKPLNYAVDENCLFEAEDNMISLKLRIAYKVLNNQL